jgi:hypothetical protein
MLRYDIILNYERIRKSQHLFKKVQQREYGPWKGCFVATGPVQGAQSGVGRRDNGECHLNKHNVVGEEQSALVSGANNKLKGK